ncbi:MAG: tRNA pseudouridine(55) synthase TruB [Candidatus Cloacimonetes bacterium]|nr:tRNA pseudouridine(55) synthase TruB [Candidatus Cloacimonadota bacterium]
MNNSGFLLIDKPEGITSFQVISQLRKITGIRKIGHTGTLDPFATGLLPLCIGNTTRLASFLSDSSKTYQAILKLGIKTDTGDITGQITETAPLMEFSEAQIASAVIEILKLQQQIPPAYSAIKLDGKRAYELARKGEEVNLASRPIHIHSFRIVSSAPPFINYEAAVSKGTYIRVLSETFAALLGNLATTCELRRTEIGNLNITQSVKLADLTSANWKKFLLSPAEVLTLPRLKLTGAEEIKFSHGIKLPVTSPPLEFCLVLSENDNSLGIAAIDATGWLLPRIVLS